MDDRKEPISMVANFTKKAAKFILRSRWVVIPILIASRWADWIFSKHIETAIIPLAADIWAIYVLGRYYREQLYAMQWKRTLLFLLDVPLCAVIPRIGLIFGDFYLIFLLIFPAVLFLINISIYRKNACDKKMFTALLFTDTLLHWVSLYVILLIDVIF